MIRFEPGPEACNGYFQISWTPSKIDSKQQLIHACIKFAELNYRLILVRYYKYSRLNSFNRTKPYNNIPIIMNILNI